MSHIENLISDLKSLTLQAKRSFEYEDLLVSMPHFVGKTVFDTLTSIPDLVLLEYPTLYQIKKSIKEKYAKESDAFFHMKGNQIEKTIKILDLKKSESASVDTLFVDDENLDYSAQMSLFESITELIPKAYKDSIGAINVYLSKNINSSFASYDKNNKSIHISLLTKTDVLGSEIAHEFGHLVENFNEEIKKRSWLFINSRLLSSEVHNLSDVLENQGEDFDENSEINVYFGEFISPYVGRIYETNGPTEVISIGLQALTLNPINFLFKDVEHFELIFELLRGKI